MVENDTIYALGSGPLPAAIAVVRMSGPLTRFALETITGRPLDPRLLSPRSLRDENGLLIDQAMAVYLPGPRSETGEDCGEFQIHGGRAILHRLIDRLEHLGLRQAQPGEFSKRAFLHGKIDLVQAEAVADLVAAETEAERRFAADNLGGRQSQLYATWRKRLLHARAMIEAELDFSDEGDVPGSVAQTVWRDMRDLSNEMRAHAKGFDRVSLLRDGFEIVILGAPNAGKSTLLNALAERDVAIVSDEAGTTRDLIEVQLSLGGNRVRLVDTAGLRPEAGKIESIGIERALKRAGSAQLVLHLIDLSNPTTALVPADLDVLTVGNKADLAPQSAISCDLRVSAETGEGMDELLDHLSRRVAEKMGDVGDVLPSRERHIAQIRLASSHLADALHDEAPLELRAESLRLGADAVAAITGAIGTEDVLGAIFSSFCIGK